MSFLDQRGSCSRTKWKVFKWYRRTSASSSGKYLLLSFALKCRGSYAWVWLTYATILSSQTNPSGVRRHFFCRWIIWVLEVNLLILWKYLFLFISENIYFYQLKFVSKRGAKRWTCCRKQRTWSENVTSRFCNHSSVIHCHYACKILSWN